MRQIAFALLAGGALARFASTPARAQSADTLRLEVGSPLVNGRVYEPHAALVRVRVGDPKGPVVREWTNELTYADSAGRRVMHWVTKAKQGNNPTYELLQTYDAVSLKPLGYNLTQTSGAYVRVSIDGNRVRGTRRTANDTAVQSIDITLDRPGFFLGASDLVPAAVGMKAGLVIIAPVWNPTMTRADSRIFTVVGKSTVDVEGTNIEAWKVEERRLDRTLTATWYLLDKSPYMVYGEVPLANGQVQYMSEVELPRPRGGG